MYTHGKIYTRKDGRLTCYLNGKSEHLSRVLYCNYHNLMLSDIQGKSVHHIDEDVSNNCKENLLLVGKSEHLSKYHSKNANGKRSNAIKKRFSKLQKKLWKAGFYDKRTPRKSKYADKFPEIKNLMSKGRTQVSISKELNIPRSSLQFTIAKGAK